MRRNMTVRGGRLQGEAKGVPQVECSVCGSVVNKRQTMAVDGVRVCKDHAWTGVQKALWAAQKRGGLPLTWATQPLRAGADAGSGKKRKVAPAG
jgi:hypothetical protein